MKLLPTIILGFILFYSTTNSQESLQANLSGSLVQGSGTVASGTFQYDGVEKIWQQHYIGDFLYKDVANERMNLNIDFGTKIDYKLNNINYLQAGIRAEYDNLRDDSESLTLETGFGHKFIHTAKLRLSDECGIGVHVDYNGSSPVISNSIWLTWIIMPNLIFSNKFLIERGWEKSFVDNDYYTSNITALSYKLSSKVELTLQHKYKKEQNDNTKVALIGLTVHLQ
jgi:putative salt-induced outer membrane protein YdiY